MLPNIFNTIKEKLLRLNAVRKVLQTSTHRYKVAVVVDLLCILLILVQSFDPNFTLISPLVGKIYSTEALTVNKSNYEVFGFAPYWKINDLDNVDFDTLTTFAYFGISVNPDGTFDQNDPGYSTFKSKKATALFQKAHSHGTRVVLTLTQMDNPTIEAFINNPHAQQRLINQAVYEVEKRGIDGINVDFEYVGNPGVEYRNKFTTFVKNITNAMHERVPNSKVTVSVYASAIIDPKIYDIASLSEVSDGIFMMAYDFAVAGSDNAIPTAPLHGHKEGKYWYDVSTAVEDFLKVMPANKLILGVPWYGYNYLVSQPETKAETLYSWSGRPMAQTYSIVQDNIKPNMPDVMNYKTGWDDAGKVGWKAYFSESAGTWRMIFLEDTKSLKLKYTFAKSKNLAGVGIWALGFDEGKTEMWKLIKDTFGIKYADSAVLKKSITNENI